MFRRRPQREQTTPALPSIAGYRDLELIGSGGFSKVYTAHQEQFARTVAVKVVTVELSDSALRRLGREQQAAGQLDGHPHVIRIYESGTTAERRPYMTMQYHDRGSYADRLRRQGTLPLHEALDVGVKLACALDVAHRQGIVHRDVKPQNVLISPFVGPVLSDFGIAVVDSARLHATSEAFTALHVAPEVLDGEPASSSSDLYSLLSTLHELLAGSAPYAGSEDSGLLELMRRVRTSPPPLVDRPDVPAVVAQQLAAMLGRGSGQRPADAAALAERLRDLQQQAGFVPTPDPVAASRPAASPAVGAAAFASEAAGRGVPDASESGGHTTPPLPSTPEQGAAVGAPPVGAGADVSAADPSVAELPSLPPAPLPPSGESVTEDYAQPADRAEPLIGAEPRRSPRTVTIVAAAVLVVVVAGAGAAWLFLAGDDSGEPLDAGPHAAEPKEDVVADGQDGHLAVPPCPDPDGGYLANLPLEEGEPPTWLELEQSGDGTAATLRWDDPNEGRNNYIVFLHCLDDDGNEDEVAVDAVAPPEPTEATLEGLALTFNYCYTVAVVGPDAHTVAYTADDGTHFRCVDATNR